MKAILVVDDEYVVLDMLAMLLEGEGYRVRKASDGHEALLRLAEEVPDVLLCDLHMPLMGGMEVVAAMADDPRLSRVVVILMVEAFGAPPPQVEVAAVVTKPIRFAELLRLLAAHGSASDPS